MQEIILDLDITQFDEDEILSIEYDGIEDTIDIVVEGTHMFYANDIYTHNSGFEADLNDEKNIGKAIEPLQVADVLITYSQPKRMVESKKCYAFLVKNRLGKKYIVLECYYDPAMCLFEELAVVDELMLMTDEQKKMVSHNAASILSRVKSGEFDKK